MTKWKSPPFVRNQSDALNAILTAISDLFGFAPKKNKILMQRRPDAFAHKINICIRSRCKMLFIISTKHKFKGFTHLLLKSLITFQLLFNHNNMCLATTSPRTSVTTGPMEKVCIIGSGNWGSAISIMIGNNANRLAFCESQVNMWVFEETITHRGESRKLSEVINEEHENVKYLPNIKLPSNIK